MAGRQIQRTMRSLVPYLHKLVFALSSLIYQVVAKRRLQHPPGAFRIIAAGYTLSPRHCTYAPFFSGHSFGSHVAIKYTLEHPYDVSGLILCAAAGIRP